MESDPLNLVGTTIADKYVVDSVVGEGGFAVVYRATHSVWKRPVALKVFKALGDVSHERRQQLLDDFVREGALLAELSERSAAIVQARDIGTVVLPQGDEVPFMVLEWLDGETLEDVLARESRAGVPPRGIEQTIELLGPVAEALALAHQKGIAHRDVKPGNVFVVGDVDGEHKVKLLDFGIAKVVQEAQKEGFRKTSGGHTSFTPLYGAPEQFDRNLGATGPWTDVFAFALVMVEVMLGREALVGDNLAQLAFSALDEKRRPTPGSYGILVSDQIEAAFRIALAVRPDDRYQNVGELWVALRAALSMGPPSGFTLASAQLRRVAPVSSIRGMPPPSGLKVTPPPPSATAQSPGLGPVSVVGSAPQLGPAATIVDSAVDVNARTARAASGSRAKLFVAAGVVALLAVVGAGVGLKLRGSSGAAGGSDQPATSASAVTITSASAAPSAVVASGCPKGMLEVAAGDYFMGSDDPKTNKDERPAHPVKLGRYCLDEFEVTAREYKACSDGGHCKRLVATNEWEGITARQRKLYDPICTGNDYAAFADHPINCVDFEAAETFCREVRGGRLPTEAEWEYAARGSDGRVYPWGDAPPAPGLLNACGSECVAWGRKNPDPDGPLAAMFKSDDGFAHTSPAGSFPRGQTSHGMKDMVGNVWEWVSDYYGPYSAGAKVSDPKGPEKGDERVIRGGAWNGGDPAWLRPSFRFSAAPTMKSHGIGFRCAKSG